MKNKRRRSSRSVSAAAGVLGVMILLVEITMAGGGIPQAPGIWRSSETARRMSAAHEEELAQSLRRITGCHQLRFAGDGSLETGDLAASPRLGACC